MAEHDKLAIDYLGPTAIEIVIASFEDWPDGESAEQFLLRRFPDAPLSDVRIASNFLNYGKFPDKRYADPS